LRLKSGGTISDCRR